jgi:hypothetical protein
MNKQSQIQKLLLLCVFAFSITMLTAQHFVHPGILHKEADLARMRQKVAERAEPGTLHGIIFATVPKHN